VFFFLSFKWFRSLSTDQSRTDGGLAAFSIYGKNARRAFSLKKINGQVNQKAFSLDEEIADNLISKEDLYANHETPCRKCLRKNYSKDSFRQSQEKEIIDDYITPEMNYANLSNTSPSSKTKDANLINMGDDISLYGTPKEEMSPGFGEVKASFMRNQIEALFQPSDNKLAMKLFGSKKALMKERLRQKESGHWIIHPCSTFR